MKDGNPVNGWVPAAVCAGATLKGGEDEGEWKVTTPSCKYNQHLINIQVVRRKRRRMKSAEKCLKVVPGLPVTCSGSIKTAEKVFMGKSAGNNEKKKKVFIFKVNAQP